MPVEAERAWKLLNGIICVYKPPEVSCGYVVHRIRSTLCKELNSMETRPVKKFLEFSVIDNKLVTNVRPSYADNVLCVGPRYQPADIKLHIPTALGNLASGVLVLGVNHGCEISSILKRLNFTRCYHIKGILGQASANFCSDGKVIAKAKFDHINNARFEKTLAFYQSQSQRRTFEEYGLDLTSQEAYDFAVRGLYRPDKFGAPIIYNLKLIEFKPPDFTLEVQCTHEYQNYLTNLIHNLGVILKSYATCTGLRCIRQGYFTVEHALLKKYWTVDHLIDNIKMCYKMFQEDYPSKLAHLPTVNTVESSLSS